MMKLSKLTVVSWQGGNKSPCSGEASFDDGKTYGWCRLNDDIVFTMSFGETKFRSFLSPKRALAIKTYLDL